MSPLTVLAAAPKPALSLAVWKFASCDGCQLSLLDCEDRLLAVATRFRIARFPEMSAAVSDGPYDVSLVEGSITTPADAERIQEVRRVSHRLVTIGACAAAGGIQALRNYADIGEYVSAVYARPDYISTLARSTPIADHVAVDFELPGCPVNGNQLVEVLTALVAGRRPVVPAHSVCQECKGKGTVCVLVATGTPCLGPITRGGCGALCPSLGRGCYGCFGPAETANTASLSRRLAGEGVSGPDTTRLLRTFNAAAPAWKSGPGSLETESREAGR